MRRSPLPGSGFRALDVTLFGPMLSSLRCASRASFSSEKEAKASSPRPTSLRLMGFEVWYALRRLCNALLSLSRQDRWEAHGSTDAMVRSRDRTYQFSSSLSLFFSLSLSLSLLGGLPWTSLSSRPCLLGLLRLGGC